VQLAPIAPLAAQIGEIEPGVRYQGGATVGVAALGLSFDIPAGWMGTLPPGAEIFLMGSETEPGLIVVVADQVGSLEEAAASLNEPLPIDTGLVLHPDGAAKREGRRFTQSYSAMAGGQKLVGWAQGIVGPTNIGVAFVAVGPEASAFRYAAVVDEIFSSLELIEPKVHAAAATEPAGSTSWDAMIRGMKLHYLYTASGYSEEEEIDLCADGTFARRNEGGGFGGGTPGASGAWQGGGSGHWSIDGNVLRLRYPDGEVGSYTLSLDGDKLLLNGSRYFRVATDRCG
jgi:hypothetical protein